MASENSTKFANADIYYNYVFDLGTPVNVIDAGRLLLKTEIGQAFRNYQIEQGEISSLYKPLVKQYAEYQDLFEIAQPPPTLKKLFKLIQRRPLESSKKILGSLKRSKTNKKRQPEQKNNNSQADDPFRTYVTKTAVDLLLLLSVQEHADREVLSQEYIASALCRISLVPFSATISTYKLDFDVTLTVHRSGVAILTFFAIFPDKLSVEEIIWFKTASKLILKECEIPTAIAARDIAVQLKYGHFSPKQTEKLEKMFHSDRPHSLRFTDKDAPSLGGIFDAYRFYVTERIQERKYRSEKSYFNSLRGTGWQGYPVVFLRNLESNYSSSSELNRTFAQVER